MQRRDVPERKASNVATLRSNIATFHRVVKTNVATFQRSEKPTSRRYREGLIQRRDVEIQRRDVPEKGQTDVTTFRRRDVATSRR